MIKEITVEDVRGRLLGIMLKFAGGGKTETGQILSQVNLNVLEILNLLDCSLSQQKEEIDRLRKSAKQQARKLESLSQGSLL